MPLSVFLPAKLRPSALYTAWLTAEHGRFALFLPVCMAAGVVGYFARATEPALWPPALIAVAALPLGIAARRRPLARAALLCAGFAAAGFASARIACWRAPPWFDVPHHAADISGRVELVEALPEGQRVTLAEPSLGGAPFQARKVRIRIRNDDLAQAYPGDTLRLRALLRPPPPPAYPGGWDMQRDAWFHDMGAYGFALGPVEVRHAATAGTLLRLRDAIAARVMAALPGAQGAIAATLLTGLGAAIPPADRTAFQASGLAHLLAVAGLHIGIVMAWVFLTVRTALAAREGWALHWPIKRIATITALAAGAVYLALTGAHIPIIRSFAMASLVTLAVLTGRRAISFRALALAAIAIMLASPEEVMGVSFQMSFAAVLALVAGWEAARPRLALLGAGRWWRRPALYVGGLALTSALAGTAAIPFAAYHFGTATLFYVPANILAVPITAVWVMPWGLVSLALMPFHLEAAALAPMGWGIGALLGIARAVAAWPGAVWPIPQMPPTGLALTAFGLAWLCLWRSHLRMVGLPPLLAGLASPWLISPPDVVVGPDARVIALRSAGAVYASVAKGADVFEREDPQRIWGTRAATPLPADGPGVHCTAAACRADVHGRTVVLVFDPGMVCAGAALVVSAAPLRGRCAPAPIIDRFSVYDNGASAAWLLSTGTVVMTDRALRGNRPWVIAPAAAPQAANPLPTAAHKAALPPAQTE